MNMKTFVPRAHASISGQKAPRVCFGARQHQPHRLGCAKQFSPNNPKGLNPQTRGVKAHAVVINDQDLLQFPDRMNWYEAKFGADDMPDWIPGKFMYSELVAPGYKNIVIEHEISRERVPLRNAYKAAGQTAAVRLTNGLEFELTVASAPPSNAENRNSLFNLKGDVFFEEIKTVKEPTSVMSQLHLLVSSDDAPELWELEEGDAVEVGPFRGAGLDLRTSVVCSVYRYRTLVLFVSGKGIAAARALLESDETVQNLSLQLREDARMYYKAPNEMSLIYKELWDSWGERGCPVTPTTNTFQDAFDDDQTLAYDPATTAAVILTGGDPEEDAAAREVCKEAEITTIVSDSLTGERPVFLSSTPKNFSRWANVA